MRVVRSDAIVRARPPSVAGELRAIPSEDAGVAPTCLPVIVFQFPIIEYIMGSGEDEITVEWLFAGYHTYLTREDAQDALDRAISNRDVTLETRDAVIFLRSAQSQQAPASASPLTARAYNFTRLWLFDDFVPDPIRNSWLPLDGAGSNAAAQTDADLLYLLGPLPEYLLESDTYEETDSPSTISLAELRKSVDAVAALLKQGEGIQAYKTCIRWRLDDENKFAHNPPDLQEPFTDEISSGLIQRIPMPSERGGGQTSLGLVNWYAEGPDAEYFQIQVTDYWWQPYSLRSLRSDIVDDLALITYIQRYATTRPLPMGVYRFVPRYHDRDRWRLCEHIPFDDWTPWEVTAVAPIGTLHEAFFDPVVDGDAIAASGSLGKLKPDSFTTDGVETTIRRIEWSPNKATITLANPPASLAGHHAEFIALDGSVALRLDFDDATFAATANAFALALSWQICAQPWQPGDLLMLRITKTPFDFGNSVTYPTRC